MATGLIPYWFNQVNNAGNNLMSLLSMPQQVNQVSNMTGMEPEFVPGAGQGPGPLSTSAATKYGQDLARFGKGAVTGTLGAPGDIESLGRGAVSAFSRPPGQNMVNAFLSGMNQPTLMPTSSDVNKAINPYMPSFMAGEATAPQQIGEFVSLGGLINQVARRAPSIARGTEPLIDMVQNAPVGLSVRPMQTPPVSGLGFYSAVEDAALNLQRNSGAGQAFLNDIKKGANVKDDEIKWIGLDEFLAGKKNVTKQEVQDYIANNRVDVQEVALGGRQPFDSERLDELLSEYNSLKQHPIDDPSFGQEKYDELIRLMNIRDQSTTDTLYQQAEEFQRMAQRAQRQGNTLVAEKYFREAEFFNTRAEKLDLEGQGMDSPPKFGQYTLPGGENYREIMLTMPNIKGGGLTSQETARLNELTDKRVGSSLDGLSDAEQSEYFSLIKKREDVAQGYKSPHFDQPNILAHIRVNDRVDADGKKMLLIEEVQSDWHQAGRDKGYKSEMPTVDYDDPAYVSARAESTRLLNEFNANSGNPEKQKEIKPMLDAAREAEQQFVRISNKKHQAVPDAPMKDTWYQLALKRALQYAAENGYDRVGLTTGARQAERYDLSKQIQQIDTAKMKDGYYMVVATDKNGKTVIDKAVKEDALPDVLGKELSKKIISDGGGTYSGLDLSIGGEGMKKYYDEVYPKFLQKYGKKWDAKMGNTTIEADGAEPVRYIDITPKMKQSITSGGQPLFSAAAPIGVGAGATADEENRNSLMQSLGF